MRLIWIAIILLNVVWFSACSASDSSVTVKTSPTLTPEEVMESPPEYPHAMPIWDDEGELVLFLRTDGWMESN